MSSRKLTTTSRSRTIFARDSWIIATIFDDAMTKNEPQKGKTFSRAMAIAGPRLTSQPTYRDYHIVKQYVLAHSK